MYYHASQVSNIDVLEPRVSNHGKPWIYFSSKRENVLVYLSNAVEKYSKETGFKYDGIWSKWGPYGFNKDGILEIQEYYPNATYETYKGISGYIYCVKDIEGLERLEDIPFAFHTPCSTKVDSCEFIADAYEEIMKEVENGNIALIKYEDFIKVKKEWLYKIIQKEYDLALDHPEYRYFLTSKFPFIKK